MRNQAYRRDKRKRELQRARLIVSIWNQGLEDTDLDRSRDDLLVRKLATDRRRCSCALCSFYPEPPLSELRARIAEKEQREETGGA